MIRFYFMMSGFALLLSGCLGVASAEESCINGRTSTGKACGKKKAKTPRKKTSKKEKACKPGQVKNEDTAGHCCWPGQGWAGKCVGTPTACPDGMEANASKSACEVPACSAGKERMRDGVHCCYPGQAWVSSQNKCVGKPSSCPGDLVVSGDSCACPAGKALTSGSESSCRIKTPDGMVLVPAGSFRMGSESGEDDEKPVHEVYVSGFFIDTYEVTVSQYEACVRAGGCSMPKKTHENGGYYNYGASGRGKHPINGVDWNQAVTYCRWAKKRLPTEAEWEKAARGTDGRKYPWGNEEPSCRYAVMDEGNDENGCGEERTWEVGSKPAGVSPYGAHDMSGNVWEWVSDWYDKDYYASLPGRDPKGPARGSYRVIRGGSWNLAGGYLRGATRNFYFGPSFAGTGYFLGFRCVRSLN